MQKNCSLVWQNALNYKDKEGKGFADIKDTALIKDIIRRSSEVRDQVMVFKLPSLIIDDDKLLTSFAEVIQLLDSCDIKIFIVHDHTNLVDNTLKLFGCDQKFIDNIKVADYKSSQIIEMVLSGYVNKRIVSKLCSLGCYAIGISCKDANLIQAKKSKLLHRRDPNKDVIDIGFISEPIIVNPEILINFEDSNIIPVIAPVASDEKGNTHLLDVNLTASTIASSLDADHLVLLCDGVEFTGGKYMRVQDVDVLKEMLNEAVEPKKIDLIGAALSAIQNNTDYVHFLDAAFPDSILLSMFTSKERELPII
ncbi:MAG TPA: acetylglutamate kinase [Rickettsia endosymbiont of Sericostoma sp.]|uniref:acetylglutamate kinase n=1 Tax=unclassified Candidatus Tisiphia TaxID=2996318 RepID=UPI001DE2AC6D|nr:acetylglutamate kinase [Rickettsia endosymbiont of Sericostoma sp. HW-2014]HJD64311.1 acetylglutamate kinase [Rickettsia endosymbiont of Sericostoma sp.]